VRPGDEMLIIEFEKSFDFFLSRKVSHGRALCPLDRKAGVKDILESYGVPHKVENNGIKSDWK
jgi:hypothetical protein